MTTQLQDLTIDARPSNLHLVRSFVAATVRESRLPQRQRSLLVLAVDEALTAILAEAAEQQACGRCTVSVDVDDVRVRVVIDDETGGAAPDLRPRRTLDELRADAKLGRRREMGIFLMRAIVDEIAFSARRHRSSRLELVKFIYPETVSC